MSSLYEADANLHRALISFGPCSKITRDAWREYQIARDEEAARIAAACDTITRAAQ